MAVTLEVTTEEKDLGVFVTPDMKSSTHTSKVAAKANSVVGRIKRTFSFMDCDMFNALYPSLVRSQMEHAVQAWSPHYRRDIDKLEKVQRRATKIIPAIKDKPYEERLKILGLPLLEHRRIRGDLIEVFKIMHGMENISMSQFFKLAREVNPHDTRGHPFKIQTPTTNSVTRRKFFDIRIIDKWNSLPEPVVCSTSINMFKNRFDAYTKRRGTFYEQ